jgi:hypothetical protein
MKRKKEETNNGVRGLLADIEEKIRASQNAILLNQAAPEELGLKPHQDVINAAPINPEWFEQFKTPSVSPFKGTPLEDLDPKKPKSLK